MTQINLKIKTRNALLWNALDKLSTQLISVGVSLSLAWLLSSGEFGLIGMLALFMALATALVDGGFSAALLRRKTLSDSERTTAFYANLLFSGILYGILFGLAPLIAAFFREPQLTALIRVLFTVQLFNGLGLVQGVELMRGMRFDRLALINTIGLLVSGIAAVVLAWFGFGVWALVAQTVLLGAVKALLLWGLGNWRPRGGFSKEAFVSLFSFGGKVTFSAILNVCSTQFYSVVLGRLFSPVALGFYTQAFRWSDMAVFSLYSTIQSATLPAFSALQEERDALMRAYRKTMRLTAFLAFPVLVGIAMVSRAFVWGVLTDKWADSVPFLQLLAVTGIFTVLMGVGTNYLKMAGAGGWMISLEWIRLLATGLWLFFTWHSSMWVIVCGILTVRVLSFLVQLYAVAKTTGYRINWQLQDILPYAALSLVMALFLFLLSFWPVAPLLLLGIQVLGGILFYVGANYLLGSVLLREVWGWIRFRNKI